MMVKDTKINDLAISRRLSGFIQRWFPNNWGKITLGEISESLKASDMIKARDTGKGTVDELRQLLKKAGLNFLDEQLPYRYFMIGTYIEYMEFVNKDEVKPAFKMGSVTIRLKRLVPEEDIRNFIRKIYEEKIDFSQPHKIIILSMSEFSKEDIKIIYKGLIKTDNHENICSIELEK